MPRTGKIAEEIAEDEQAFEGAPQNSRTRMVDWVQSLKVPIVLTFYSAGVCVVVFWLLDQRGSQWIPAIMAVLGLLSAMLVLKLLVSQLSGFLFDAERDKLSYPLYVLRRTMRLSEINDANCQTTRKTSFYSILIYLFWNDGKRFQNSSRYIVNVSGDFGARRIIFRSKYKRDQFLSLLHIYAPQCRITRWV